MNDMLSWCRNHVQLSFTLQCWCSSYELLSLNTFLSSGISCLMEVSNESLNLKWMTLYQLQLFVSLLFMSYMYELTKPHLSKGWTVTLLKNEVHIWLLPHLYMHWKSLSICTYMYKKSLNNSINISIGVYTFISILLILTGTPRFLIHCTTWQWQRTAFVLRSTEWMVILQSMHSLRFTLIEWIFL